MNITVLGDNSYNISAGYIRCLYNAVNFLPNPHKIHPTARPSGRAMGCNLWFATDLCFASVNVVLYEILCYIGPRYNGTTLYLFHCYFFLTSIHLLTTKFSDSHYHKMDKFTSLGHLRDCVPCFKICGSFQYKDDSKQYRDPHNKDQTILSLKWGSLYPERPVFILKRGSSYPVSGNSWQWVGPNTA